MAYYVWWGCADGSGMAAVVQVGCGPVVGIALEDKRPETDVVRAMVSVGFNALGGCCHAIDAKIMARLRRLSNTLAATSRDAKAAREQTDHKFDNVTSHLEGLQKRINRGAHACVCACVCVSAMYCQPGFFFKGPCSCFTFIC